MGEPMQPGALSYTDKAHLLTHDYGSTEDYKVRSSGWEQFRVNPVELVTWVLGPLSLEGSSAILDVGCGLGRFALAAAERAPGARVVAVDISAAMVDAVSMAARDRQLAIETSVAGIEELPFSSETFDVVLCNYVLYHVESIPKALDELLRVLKPGGRLVSVVPSFRWLHELIDWQDRALLRLGHDIHHPLFKPTGTDRFCEENATRLLVERSRVVSRERYDGTMRFPSVEMLLHHYRHTMRFKNAVAMGIDADALAREVGSLMGETLAREGRLQVTSLSTCFVCAKE
jgi:SAM-dependent methyltransferase